MSAESRKPVHPVFGYVEGYYGRLLSWAERILILETLSEQSFNTYFYGPKDDAQHRVAWREDYDANWRQSFRQFTKRAQELHISVIAGVAPGLDFDFADLNPEQGDLALLYKKSQQLLDDGAAAIGLMMDDIDNDFHKRCGNFNSEGKAHASLANLLLPLTENHGTAKTNLPRVFCVPRIYANELLADNDLTMPAMSVQAADNSIKATAEAADYMQSFTSCLDQNASWVYCGKHVVSSQPEAAHSLEIGANLQHKVVIWDNYYANDYCPRRLFLGPWQGRRECTDLLINGTGLPHTDCLLLGIVAAIRDACASEQTGNQSTLIIGAWHKCLIDAGVPDDFFKLQAYFSNPVFSDTEDGHPQSDRFIRHDSNIAAEEVAVEEQIAAIDTLLWRWKAPLAREWYPYLFGLKQDLQIANGLIPELRIRKTQTPALANYLASLARPSEQ